MSLFAFNMLQGYPVTDLVVPQSEDLAQRDMHNEQWPHLGEPAAPESPLEVRHILRDTKTHQSSQEHVPALWVNFVSQTSLESCADAAMHSHSMQHNSFAADQESSFLGMAVGDSSSVRDCFTWYRPMPHPYPIVSL